MQKVFVTYNLKPGVTLEQYTEWSRAVDQQITPGERGVIRFEVYAIEGVISGKQFYQIIEDIEVVDHETWVKSMTGPGMDYVRETFPIFADADSMSMVYGSKIVAALPHGTRPDFPRP